MMNAVFRFYNLIFYTTLQSSSVLRPEKIGTAKDGSLRSTSIEMEV